MPPLHDSLRPFKRLDSLTLIALRQTRCTSALVHPREVFKAALLANAAAIVLSH
ncbi:MAG: JAB domain-containing protein [Acidobacteriota bacterium]